MFAGTITILILSVCSKMEKFSWRLLWGLFKSPQISSHSDRNVNNIAPGRGEGINVPVIPSFISYFMVSFNNLFLDFWNSDFVMY